MSVEPADADKRAVKDRVVSIVHHQTSPVQPDSVALEHVKVVASHASVDPGHVEWAVEELVEYGSLVESDAGYRLGSATITHGEVSL